MCLCNIIRVCVNVYRHSQKNFKSNILSLNKRSKQLHSQAAVFFRYPLCFSGSVFLLHLDNILRRQFFLFTAKLSTAVSLV